MRLILSSEAEDNIKQAIHFYNQQKAGLGSYFLSSIMDDIGALKTHYGIHLKINNYHKMQGSIFPFAIYYKVRAALYWCRHRRPGGD